MSTSPSVTAATENQPWPKFRPFAYIFLAALAVVPVAAVVHEMGHYISQLLLGYEDVPFISYAGATMGTAPDDPTGLIDGLTSAAGPVFSLALVLAGVIIARRGGPIPLALALIATDCFRVLASFVFNGILAGDSPIDGLSNGFSELAIVPYHLDMMWATVLVSVIDLALPLAAAVLVYRLLHSREVAMVGAKFLSSFVGVIVGMVLWLGVVGPVILP